MPAYSGEYIAWLGYASDNRHSAAIGQKVTLPNTWPLYLNHALYLYSEETCEVGLWDSFGLYFDGFAIQENQRLCWSDTFKDGWHQVSFDISTYAGQTVMLVFQISSGGLQDPLASYALLDALHLSDMPW